MNESKVLIMMEQVGGWVEDYDQTICGYCDSLELGIEYIKNHWDELCEEAKHYLCKFADDEDGFNLKFNLEKEGSNIVGTLYQNPDNEEVIISIITLNKLGE